MLQTLQCNSLKTNNALQDAKQNASIDNRATKRDWKRAKNLWANAGKLLGMCALHTVRSSLASQPYSSCRLARISPTKEGGTWEN